MKQIVDYETGEVIDVEEENEIATRKLYEVGAIDESTFDIIENYLTAKEQYETLRYVIEKAMKENNIKTWSNDYFVATLKEESVQKRVDNDRLKEDGLYEKYLKLVPIKASLSIKFKGEK